MTDQKPRKTKTIALSLLSLVVVAGLAIGATLLLTKHKSSSEGNQISAQTATAKTAATATPDTSHYKLAACTSGATQTIGNTSYVVGTDFAPGSYKVVSQTGDIGWTNINVYNSKDKWVKQGSPSIERGVADQSLEPNNGTITYTKLTDGQYMQIDSDPVAFTCQ